MKRKNNSLSKIGVIFLVSIMALTAAGAGYSAWFDTITVHGTVSTGSVEWKFVDYSGTYVWKVYDAPDTGYGLETVVTDDPTYSVDPANGFRVAYAEAVEGSTDHEAIVTYYNLFPCIDFAADVVILYTGTIPGKINQVGFYDLDTYPENFWPDDADEVAIDQHTTLTIDIYDASGAIIEENIDPELLYGYQLHLGYTIHIVMKIHLPQDNTLMNLNGEFGVWAEVVQWNEYVPPGPPEPQCLVAYWAFDEGTGATASDSENGYDGVINGATWTTTSVSGNALSFDGDNDYVDTGNALSLLTDFTVMAWVQPFSIGSDKQVISKGYDGTNTQWELKTSTADGKVDFRTWVSGGPVGATSTQTLQEDTWVHLTGTFDGTTWRIYWDGVLDNEMAGTGPTATTENLYIGAVDHGGLGIPAQFWHGLIDEVKIFSCVLDADQIFAEYQAGI